MMTDGPRAVYDWARPAVGASREREPQDSAMLPSQALPVAGGALNLTRLVDVVVTRDEALSQLPQVVASTSHRYRLPVGELLPELPFTSAILQAAQLSAALPQVLGAIDFEDAVLARHAAELTAQRQAAADAQEEEAREAYRKQAEQAARRGRPAPTYERRSFVAENPLQRPWEVPGAAIKAGFDPSGYIDPASHDALRISEQRTTLAYERRDVKALHDAANQRIGADLAEIADLVETIYDARPGHIPEAVEIGHCLSAWCRLRAATSDHYAYLIWERALAHWRRQMFEDD